MNDLTVKQKRFADEYIISGNATEAYKKAGYKASSDRIAGVEGHKLLRNPKIETYIGNRMEQLASEKIADQQEVLEYLTAVMRGETQEQTLCSVGEFGQQVIDIDVGAKDRIKSAELLGKRYGMWTEKVDHKINTLTFSLSAGSDDQ